ncbi:TPA: restriction endonuclease subunit S [Klebsiella variicola subsp. variicola]
MNELNFLEKLLDGIDVEWMSLGNIGSFIRGNGLQKKDFVESGFPAIHYGQIYTRYGLSADKTFTYVSPELANKLRKAQRNDLLLATTSENDEDVVKPLAWLGGEAAISGDMMLFRHEQNVKYLAHFFQSEMFQKQKMKYISGAKVRRVSSGDLAKIKTPIPCPNNPEKSLAIQSEIVRILDKFTALTAELTAELTMRKKQYNYYRDQLLSFKEGEVEWKTLGEVATFRRGTAITQKQTTPGDIPVVANGPTPTYFHSESNRQDETIVIARSGAYAGYVSFWNQPIFLTDAFSVHPNLKIVKPKFLYYVLQNKQEHIHAMKKGAGVPHVRVKEFESYDVPIPPLAEQVRIVTILDKFDTLTNSITEGLPREIELRQKQYEYYRDMLFSFPKPDVVEA